jgi:hypothetical protein
VHWPDGHSTKGIEKHIEDLKAVFVWALDMWAGPNRRCARKVASAGCSAPSRSLTGQDPGQS